MEQDLSLREALAEDRLDDFVRQEEDRGAELANGCEFERALALLIAQRMSDTQWMSRSISTIHTLPCIVKRYLDAPLLLPTARFAGLP